MDLYQLRYFLEVARELNFSRAAANLHISTPAVSRSVALLENSLQKKLFVRTKRHVSLTAEGALLKSRTEGIYDQIEQAKIELAGGVEDPPMFRIGSREMITNYLLDRPLLAFKKSRPNLRFGIYELDPLSMAEALKKDWIDFGFYYSSLADPALECRRLGRLDSHLYASKALFRGGAAPKTPAEVLKLPFVAPRYFRGDPAQPSVDGFPDQLHPRKIQYEAELMETHRRFVIDGLAAGVLPDLVMEGDLRRRRVMRLPGPKLFRDIFFIKRMNRPLPKSADLFCRGIQFAMRSIVK